MKLSGAPFPEVSGTPKWRAQQPVGTAQTPSNAGRKCFRGSSAVWGLEAAATRGHGLTPDSWGSMGARADRCGLSSPNTPSVKTRNALALSLNGLGYDDPTRSVASIPLSDSIRSLSSLAAPPASDRGLLSRRRPWRTQRQLRHRRRPGNFARRRRNAAARSGHGRRRDVHARRVRDPQPGLSVPRAR